MTVSGLLLSRRRLVLTVALLLSAVGWVSWTTMPRQEDPDYPGRWGQLIVVFPGAEATEVERLVVEPLEEQLAEVDEIAHVELTARAGVAIGSIELNDTIYDTEPAFDQVRDALARAQQEMPDAVWPADFDTRLVSTESVLLALTGPQDPGDLVRAAHQLESRLQTIPSVSRINITADPGQQVTIELDGALAASSGLTPLALAAQLEPRNVVLPGGTVNSGGRSVVIRPQSQFRSLAEIAQTPIALPSGAAVPLSQLATVAMGPTEPAGVRMRHGGQPAIAVGVVPRSGVDVVAFGEDVQRVIDDTRGELGPVQIHEVAFQPVHVEQRLASLSLSLLLGIVIVAGVLLATMGPRLGLTVAAVVPLVALSALGIFGLAGGTLHQISIAALVLSLGLLVDNAIVVAESIQRRIDVGEDRVAAAAGAVRELAVPLATATGTTMAAFVPMLLAKGVTADFTRSLPIVIMLTLSVSYLFAITVTPTLSAMVLRRRGSGGESSWARLARRFAGYTVRRPWRLLAMVAVLVVLALGAAGGVRQQFFPATDRAIVIVDLELPEGTHLDLTDAAAAQLAQVLEADPDVVSVTSFIGRGTPSFYYNLLGMPNRPHVAQLVVRTVDKGAVERVCRDVRRQAGSIRPQPSVVARGLEQGPPVAAPVEIRVSGESHEELLAAAEQIAMMLRQVEGAVDVHHNLGSGSPTVRWEVHDASAARYGISRRDVALALLEQTRGLEIGQLRSGDDPVPIVIRSPLGEDTSLPALAALRVQGQGGVTVPLEQLATQTVEWRPAAIAHRDGARTASVTAQLQGGATFSDVLDQLEPRLAAAALPAGVRVEYGGAAEGSGDANSSMTRALPVGLLLLLFFLLAEFNSFRRVAIILTTVPLAAVGVIPGLLISDQPFGFMSFLGVIALVGIVVNNAIVLIDLIDRLRRDGLALEAALVEAVTRRARPILLTTMTTIAGLIPLATSASTLWPPLATAMISGLLSSTVLTLVVVPALYRLAFTRPPHFAPNGSQLPAPAVSEG